MYKPLASELDTLLSEIRQCELCKADIPEPRPVLRANVTARLLIIGQAPGTRVHSSGIPWDDASGKRLRQWLQLSPEQFYDESKVAIVPMGFCYPGKGKSGDLPPRRECAATWHERLMALLPNIECTLLIGQYAQAHYLNDSFKTLSERVKHWQEWAPRQWVLPHPSPRNQLWLRNNPNFENETVPVMRQVIHQLLDDQVEHK